jgi:hypothetical protein
VPLSDTIPGRIANRFGYLCPGGFFG